MTALSFAVAVYLRLGNDVWQIQTVDFVGGLLTLTAIGAVVYLYTGLYRGVWRYASIRDLAAITRAVSLTVLIFVLAMFVWTRLEPLPRSIPFINWFVLMAMLGGPRLIYRFIRDRSFDLKDDPDGRRRIPVLLAGSGDGAEMFIRSLGRSHNAEYQIVGILTERQDRVGLQIHQVSILGTLDHLPDIVKDLSRKGRKPQRLILTKDTTGGAVVRQLFSQTTELGMTLARVPSVTEFKPGDPDIAQVQPIDIEDLLGRPQTSLDRTAMGLLINGRRVLVTGAGGSIGGELVRQIIALEPSEICLIDNSEFALYQIDREVVETKPDLMRHAIIADVRNSQRVEGIFSEHRPELVFHAAALKHVPLVEENCCEGVSTNVLGSFNVANACVQHGVATMVQISTDKAINPTNIMGASKRIAEQYCQALDLDRGKEDGTKFVTVRFGNVLGSTGSVVPLFQRQLKNGGPLTVTHPDMTRYFMTVRESVELVLLASAMAQPGAGHDGKIFVLDMGEPVHILDLARQMIRLAGHEPDHDIKIEFTGVRPGEKLFEEIFHDGEELTLSAIEGIFIGSPRAAPIQILSVYINKLMNLCAENDAVGVRALLADIVPEASFDNCSSGQGKL